MFPTKLNSIDVCYREFNKIFKGRASGYDIQAENLPGLRGLASKGVMGSWGIMHAPPEKIEILHL